MKRHLLIAGVISSLLGLGAQQGIHLPQDPVLLLELDGPARLRTVFAASNLLRMLESPEAAELGRAVRDELLTEDAQLYPFLEGLWDSLSSYEGRLRLGMHVVPVEDSFFPSLLFTLEMTDAGSDRKALMQLLDGLEGTEQQLLIRGEKLRVFTPDDVSMEFTMPTLIDGKQVTIFGHEISSILPEFLSVHADNRVTTKSPEAPISARFDVPAFMERLFPKNEFIMPLKVTGLMDELGFLSLQPINTWITPAGKHIVMRTEIGWDPTKPGLTGLFLSPRNSEPHGLLDLVPRTSLDWSLMHLDLGKAYAFLKKVLGKTPFADAFPTLSSEIDVQIRMSLEKDLLAHLGDEILVLGKGIALEPDSAANFLGIGPLHVDVDLAETEDEDEYADPPELGGDVCIAISLDDEKAFATSLEKLIRSRGLHASRRRSEHRGVRVQMIFLLGTYQISYAIADGLFLAAYGKDGLENLRAVLDMSAQKQRGEKIAALPRLIRDRLKHVGKRWQDLSTMSLAPLLTAPEFQANRKLMYSIADMFKKYDVNVMVTATDYAPARATSTTVW